MSKSACLKWTYGRPGIDYRVAVLFTRYPTAIGIIPESLKSIDLRWLKILENQNGTIYKK